MSVDRVGVVGTGLIGTSIGLALARTGQRTVLVDADRGRAAAAEALGAGRAVDSVTELGECDHVVVAVPPRAVAATVTALCRLALDATISDVSSVKAKVLDEVETSAGNVSWFCGGHPIAGRERGGPGAAQPALFDGAVWAVTPTPATSAEAIADTAELATRCGARPVEIPPDVHDDVLARVSHAPQFLASLMAAHLGAAGALGPVFAGTGFRDTTRLADSDPELWVDIAAANASRLGPVLRQLGAEVLDLAVAVERADMAAVRGLLEAGRTGRARLPGKPHMPPRAWAHVGVVLADRPGELARLFADAAGAGVNIEDVRIEHAPDHPAGHVDLHVRPEATETLLRALQGHGWTAHRTG